MYRFILLLLLMTSSYSGKSQLFLQFAENPEEWSTPQQFTIRDRTGIEGKIEVSVKFLKRRATTCMLVLDVKNIGNTEFRGSFKVTANEMGALSTINSMNTNIKPGKSSAAKLEMRECLPKGAKGKSDIQRCMMCRPKLYFAGNIIR